MLMLTRPTVFESRLESKALIDFGYTRWILAALVVLLLGFGIVQADSLVVFAAYLMLLVVCILPSLIWFRAGARGIPILPVLALGHIPYYAIPIVRRGDALLGYGDDDLLRVALTVVLYLGAAIAGWMAISVSTRARPNSSSSRQLVSPAVLHRLMGAGLMTGALFQLLVALGWIGWLGTFFGTVRAIVGTFTVTSCYLLGMARGGGQLRGGQWLFALAGLAFNVVINWMGFFLVAGLFYLIAALIGYCLTARRFPWGSIAVMVGIVAVLHVGKGEMRARYWYEDANFGDSISLQQMPSRTVEWIGIGLQTMFSGEVQADILERASLLNIILRAQRDTPEQIDFLNGETYAFLPSVLLPRFLVPDKPTSQVAMDLLNIRYGILTREGAASTAVGWGLIAEAYVNFGYAGIFACGFLIGLLCGGLARWTADAGAIALPTLIGIAVLMILLNMEADFIQVFLTLMQGTAAVLIFYGFFRLLMRQETVVRSTRQARVSWESGDVRHRRIDRI
jgi:hypothetical protein